MTKVTLTMNRIRKSAEFVTFEFNEEDLPFKTWKKSDRRRYFPVDSPFAKAKTITLTLDIVELNGEE